jgi:hypothetical protein
MLRAMCSNRSSRRAASAALAAILAVPAVVPSAADGQSPVLLPPDHWTLAAVRTLDARGLLGGSLDYGRRRMTLGEAARHLRQADAGGDPGAEAMLSGYRTRFAREFPEDRMDASGAWIVGAIGPLGVLREGEFGTRSGRLAGTPEKTIIMVDVEPAPRRPDGLRARPAGWLASGAGRFGAAVAARPTTTGDVVYDGHAAARFGALALWAGRLSPGYGPGRHGSQVLSGEREVIGAGFSTARPFRLPWILGGLGDIRLESFLGGLDRSRDLKDPLLWGMRASAVPHPRVGFGVSRAAMFGGEGNGGFSFEHFLEVLFVDRGAGVPFENQVGAIDLWFRPPLGELPLVAWVEWGSDDSSGGLSQVPGLVTGVAIPSWPGAPSLGITLESMWMAGQCCGNGPWYWHTFFASGWGVDGRLFGHPLGGQGHELLLGVDLAPPHIPADLSVDLYRRDRGPENLYAPVWEGVSRGAELRGAVRVGRWDLSLLGYIEDGDRWRRGGASLGARLVL